MEVSLTLLERGKPVDQTDQSLLFGDRFWNVKIVKIDRAIFVHSETRNMKKKNIVTATKYLFVVTKNVVINGELKIWLYINYIFYAGANFFALN